MDLDNSLSCSVFNGNGQGTPTQKKKMRRSWFETPPAAKLEIAAERKKRRSSGAGRRRSDEEVETLLLTHFTSAPRIGFGNIKVGKAKSRILILRNPHEYEQEVIVERFPYKKSFSIDQTKFIVPAEDYTTVSITWSPDEVCNSREMILFKVDGVYRLQAYVFGCAEAVKKQKPVKKSKKGLLGIKVKKPFSIISTPGLACIRDNYSPLDAEKPRMSNLQQHPVIPEHCQLIDKQMSNENTPPPLESTAISISSVGYINNECVTDLGCSPTFSPILKTSEYDGSCIVTDSLYSDTQFSTLKDIDNLQDDRSRISDLDVKHNPRVSKDKNVPLDTPKTKKKKTSHNSSRNQSKDTENKENSPCKRPRTKSVPDSFRSEVKKCLSPETFLNDSLCREKVDSILLSSMTQITGFACINKEQTVSPTSFLEDLNNTRGNNSFKNEVPSPSRILQNSIPHNLIVQQLQNVRTSLHEQSFEKLMSSAKKGNIRKTALANESTFDRLSVPKGGEVRRNTFLKRRHGTKACDTVTKDETYPSPRRTTFLISLKKCKSIQKKDESTKNCAKYDVAKEDKPKKRKLLTSNKVGQTPVSKQSKHIGEKGKFVDSCAKTRTKETPTEATMETELCHKQIFAIFSGTVTKDRPSPLVENAKKNSGKCLFDANCPKKNTSPLARTVTKDRPSPQVQEKVFGKKLFDDTEIITPKRNSPFIDEFGSPSVLPSSPSEITTRRTTLTVTKSRPSDALLFATQTALCNNMFECTPTGKPSNNDEKNENYMVVEINANSHINLDKKEAHINQSEIGVFTQDPVSPNLLGSPVRIPTSPNPETSRRSTPLITSPKVVNLNVVSPRRLFAPMEFESPLESSVREKEETLNTSCQQQSSDVDILPKEMILRPDVSKKCQPYLTTRHLVCEKQSPVENSECLPSEARESITNESTLSIKSLDEDFSQDQSDISIESEFGMKTNSLTATDKFDSTLQDISNKSSDKKTIMERKAPSCTDGKPTKRTQKTPRVFTGSASPKSQKTRNKPQTAPTNAKMVNPNVDVAATNRRQSISSSRERLDLVGKPVTDRRRSVYVGATKSAAEKKFEVITSLTKSTNNRNVPRETPLKTLSTLSSLSESRTEMTTKSRCLKSVSVSGPVSNQPRKVSVSSMASSVKKPRGPMKGVAQSKLMLIKKPKTAVPKHPMPFAARNMYYDERWQEKQERGFSYWLNFVLTPPEEYNNNAEKTKVDAGKIFVDGMKGSNRLAPTKEVLSIRAYTARRRMNRLRRASCILYQSEIMIHVIRKVEIEVESRRLAVRKDRMLHADLGIKQKILDMLLCYNPLWLRIGLETIFGEMILLQSNNDVIGLSRFILYRLLSNPDIAAEYAHPTVPHLYRDGFAEASSSHTLKKFLLLIYFLDQAKQSRLIDHDPCLFCKNADIKASKNFLVQFSRDFLSGEGDVNKHLGYLGYIVTHAQTALDEFDYAVSALGVDLRDGLRLTRVMEFLTNDWTLLSRLRAPAISRLQKIHNVEVVFKVLAERGLDVTQLDTKLNTRDIVDGHKEKTLNLLWHIIFHFQVDVLIDIEQLKSEITILEKTLRVKVSMQELLKTHSADNQARRDSGETDVLKNERLTLLLKWCRLVCLHYGIKVENFTVSFSDGRALCYLIHHYYPALLPLEQIKQQTTLSYMEEMETKEEEEFNEDDSFDWSRTPHSDLEKPEMFEQYLHNERENFKLIYEKVSGLGGIPLMLKSTDMSNTIPDEKIVMTYVSHLCGRLLDIRAESRAARVIQIAWRRYWLHHAVQHQKKLNSAAIVIQTAYREYRSHRLLEQHTRTATKIQAMWRGYKARKRAVILRRLKANHKMSEAALLIQRALKSNLLRQKYLRTRTSAITIQSAYRGYRVRLELKHCHAAAEIIQSFYRGYKQMLKDRSEFLLMKSSAIAVQNLVRLWLKRRAEQKIQAAIVIQKNIRSYLQRCCYLKDLKCIVRIQANFRRHKYQIKFLAMKFAAMVIQRYYRHYSYCCLLRVEKQKQTDACVVVQRWWRCKQQENLKQKNLAANNIQAIFRGYMSRKRVKKQKEAVLKMQSIYKMKKARFDFIRTKAAAIVLQHHIRIYLQKKHLLEALELQNAAATKIQSQWKAHMCSKKFHNQKSAAVKIQSFVRLRNILKRNQIKQKAAICIQQKYRAVCEGRFVREEFKVIRLSVVKIQATFRAFQAKRDFQNSINSAVKIQSFVKMVQCRKLFLRIKWATLILQTRFRVYQLRKIGRLEIMNKNKSAIVIQAQYRGYRTRKQLQMQNKAATKIQAVLKMCCAVKKFQTLRQTAVALQKIYRNNQKTKHVELKYIKMKSSAMAIQRVFRLYLERRNHELQSNSVVKIQALVRGYLARKSYLKYVGNVKCMQRLYRRTRVNHILRKNYLLQKHCATKIQCQFRGYLARKSYQKQKQAAILIQSLFRMLKQRGNFQKLRATAIKLQTIYKNNLIATVERRLFNKKKLAAIKIQAWFRGHLARNMFVNTLQAVLKIQTWLRKSNQEKTYQKMKSTVVSLQRIYRNNMVAKSGRQIFLEKKQSVIIIQACFRGYQARKIFCSSLRCVLKIQNWFRKTKQQNAYKKLKSTAVCLQRIYRNNVIAKSDRQTFLNQKHAVMKIQACFRSYRHDKSLRAATKIQAWWRKTRQQIYYRKLKSIVIGLQIIIRKNQFAKLERTVFIQKRLAVIKIQSIFRDHLSNKKYQTSVNAAVKIQSWWRCVSARRIYLTTKHIVVLLQRRVRSNREVKKQQSILAYKKLAALKIQILYKGYKARQIYRRKSQAAIIMQSAWRVYTMRRNYLKLKNSAIAMQQIFRKKMLAIKCREDYMQLRSTVLFLQTIYKGKIVRQSYLAQKCAAVKIQAKWRSFTEQTVFIKKRDASKTIQRFYRMYKLNQIVKADKLKQSVSAVIIQRFWRSYKVDQMKKQSVAATKIQSMVKGYLACKHYKLVRKSVVCMQALYRGNKCRQTCENTRMATLLIQRKWRATCLSRKYRRRYLITYGAIITIQASFRGFSARKHFMHCNKECIKIQACVRGYLQRQKYLELKCAALVLQEHYHSNRLAIQTRTAYLQKKQAVLVIQKWYRSCKLEETRKLMNAAITIQSWFRCVKQRRSYCTFQSHVIRIQASIRGFLSRKQYQYIQSATITIQRCVRSFLFVKRKQKVLAKRHIAALLIQQIFRKFVKLKTEEFNKAAIKIQKHFRGYYQRKLYKLIIESVILIQSSVRCYLAKGQLAYLLKRQMAARRIQSCYRLYRDQLVKKAIFEERKVHLHQVCKNVVYHLAAIKIQRCYRRKLLLVRARQSLSCILHIQRMYRATKERRQFVKLRCVICQVQSKVRLWLKQRHTSALVIQKSVRQWLVQHRLQKQENNAVKIQALWRGYLLRKKTHTKKMAEIRRRITKANESACEENKLGNRTASALDYLLRYKQMSYILEAVMHLEVATRLSPRCCERMVEVNAVGVIYRLMKSCNRSLPHMEVIKYSISILLNLAKYEKTIDYVYNVADSVSNLLELMTIFREKGDIFTKSCTLMGILALDNERRQAIVSNRNYTDKIRSMYAITARKHKLEEGRNIVRAKLAASKTFNSTLPLSTPAKKRKIRPDWLLNRDSIHEIRDPMRAIKFVMDNLGLTPK